MSHLTIRNIGPIREVDIDLNKVNVIIGPQSSGKSTIAKIASFCYWLEKHLLVEQNVAIVDREFANRMLLGFHEIESYLNDDYFVKYVCDTYEFEFSETTVEAKWSKGYHTGKVCKISYIPATRNFASLRKVASLDLPYINTRSFIFDWLSIKEKYSKNNKLQIPVLDVQYYYDEPKGDVVVIRDYNKRDKEIDYSVASSGIQSAVPVFVLFDYLTKWIYAHEEDRSFDKEQKIRKAILTEFFRNGNLNFEKETIEAISKDDSLFGAISDNLSEVRKFGVDKFNEVDLQPKSIQSAINTIKLEDNISRPNHSKIIIEEPEQNLFPETQKKLVYELIRSINDDKRDHRLLLTTHSSYILYALNNCMMGGLVGSNIPEGRYPDFESYESWINPKEVSVWQVEAGGLTSLQDEDGILEDNYFNQSSNGNSNEYLRLLNYYDESEDS